MESSCTILRRGRDACKRNNQRKCCCCCCCCLQVEHKCRAAGPFCGEGESDACTSRSNVGQRGKKALEWPLTPPRLCFTIQMVNQPLWWSFGLFLLSVNACKKIHFSVGLHVGPAQGGLNDTFTWSQGPNFALKWDSGSNLSICTVGLVGKHCP